MNSCKHDIHTVGSEGIRCVRCNALEKRTTLMLCITCNEWRPLYIMSNDTMCNVHAKCSYCMMPHANPNLQVEISWS